MNKTKIEYVDYTWNPITGCLNTCEYCYARKIVNRFAGWRDITTTEGLKEVYNKPVNSLYPYLFTPTFHHYRLDEPLKLKKPSIIFVCSMADLFAEWILDEWITQVFDACKKAPQHTYIFLTKNPRRYHKLFYGNMTYCEDNWFFGSTVTSRCDDYYVSNTNHCFINIEPLKSDVIDIFGFHSDSNKWCIIGAETGIRKGKVIPKREWVEKIVNKCREYQIPIFMKNNLKSVWQDDLIQEYPIGF